MSSRSVPVGGRAGRKLAASESPLTNLQGSRQAESTRSRSAPAPSAPLVETILQAAVETQVVTTKTEALIRPPAVEDARGEKRRRSSSPSSSLVAVAAGHSRKSTTRAASMPLQSAGSIERHANGSEDGDAARPKEQGSAPTPQDFAMRSQEVPRDHATPHPEHTARDEADATPSKRVKSDIAPWMTQRHKNAIRRSLGATTATEGPVEASPSQTGAARKGRARGSDQL
ncbi:uncharacterized protein SRS1_14008 [Sporisorium reilianum f. sp. reilianum]|uniref:Uncharacterized protein n=1 Tax=Sporisorium reilianum f. sp. reilianum TaxID=72559 RepID=A0A2N8UDX8_9BASI|nr:uncharacterized protein SRS1_14008 [Sporisorium reilianum f. sp. reilianum]